MNKNIFYIVMIMFISFSSGQEIVLTGKQESVIEYKLEQSIVPFMGIDVLMVSFVVPADFNSPTYSQNISDLEFDFSPSPKEQESTMDDRGNQIRKFYWDAPESNIRCRVTLKANNQVKLLSLKSETAFPLSDLPRDVNVFIQATDQVQAKSPEIVKLAKKITKNTTTEFQAVQAILHYIVDNLRYVLVPRQYDALYALRTGKGNCQNYSHLAAALMRAVNIPARIVNGITLNKAYDIKIGAAEYSFEMAQGRHSWIEVYFPDIGWLPFDAQQTEFFVSNRYLRIEVGLDNEETIQDGLVRWTHSRGSEEKIPRLEEAIESTFINDRVSFLSQKKLAGPTKLLLTPAIEFSVPVLAAVEPEKESEPEQRQQTEPELEPKPEPQEKPEPLIEPHPEPVIEPEPTPEPEEPSPPQIDYRKLKYNKQFDEGNLEFPRQFDFLYARLEVSAGDAKSNQLKRNFIVETAEYVTSREEFAQTFILNESIMLKKIGLALHNFGGDGFLWLELSEDREGKPGETAARSARISNNHIRFPKGYDWVDFDFSREGLLLTPGRYWFVLKYSGSPIVNWFYSYGKPVGPVDGTRRQMIGRHDWNKILTFEFNYRVTGLAAE